MKVTVSLSGSEAGDVAVTAAEGGIGYWSQIDEYRPSRWFTGDGIHPDDVDDDFVFYGIAEQGRAGYDWENTIKVTPALIERGLQAFIDQDLGVYGFDPLDLETIDSTAADMLIQLGAFGEVRYG